MKQNIKLIYILSFLRTTWFWLGVWVYWYLKFTDYAGIGLIESIMVATMTLLEIPTGAIADLLGRKNTLIVSFIGMAANNIIMGLATNLYGLIVSVVIGSLGATLFSGTIEAIAYDSLKVEGSESKYDKVVSNMNSLQLIAMCLCGALGGFVYQIDPRFPFLFAGLFNILGIIIAFFLIEPSIDSEKFSFSNFALQTKQGFVQLFKSNQVIAQTIILLIIGSIMTVSDEMIDSILAFEFGFTPVTLGIFTSVVFAFAALVSQLSSKLNLTKHFHLFILGLLVALSFIISPFVGIVFGGLSIILRNGLRLLAINTSSVLINQSAESKYRATTISTFNMLKNIPYALSAFYIGTLMDNISAKLFTFYLGLILLIMMFLVNLPKVKTSRLAFSRSN